MKTYNPTSPGSRQKTTVDFSILSKQAPQKSLLKRLKTHAGRNSAGRITVRHQGGGHKKLYRLTDFKQLKLDIPGRVEGIEYDPYRAAFLALVVYPDGARAYILAAEGMKAGDVVLSSEKADIKVGNRMRLKNILIGTEVHNIEMQPNNGGIIVRSAGSRAIVLAHEEGYTNLELPSKEVRRILWNSFASVGQVSNAEHSLTSLGKAGRSRWLGIRPTVRGTAMNPVDHPYGGGEGVQPRGTRKPKTMWGKVTGGRKTRNKKKWSNKLIVKRHKGVR